MTEQPLLFETDYNLLIAGTDEAGRGPLAGPVCAACVVLPDDFPFEILDDSKKLSEKKRYEAEIVIKEKSIAWAITFVSHKEIDRINILNASLLAMKKSFEKVSVILNEKQISKIVLLADGNKKPPVDVPCKAVVKGDATIHQIMAASILAKNARDRFMLKAAEKWPEYGFEIHKGYPTLKHIEAIRKYGPCPIHRLSFGKNLFLYT